MRFAIAGNNATAFHVLQELAGSTEHTLVCCALSGELASVVSRRGVPVRLAASIEDALLAGDMQTVIVAIDDPDESLRIVRAASQADRHVIVIPPAVCSPPYSFELHLILDESKCGIMPLLPRTGIVELPLTAVDLRLDEHATRQLSIELPLTGNSPEDLRTTAIRGLDYLSACGFRYTQVTALQSNAPDGSLLSQLITLSTATTAETPLPPATLTIRPSLVAEDESLLQISQNNATIRSAAIVETANAVDRIVTVSQSRELCADWMEAFSVTLELSEAVTKSLRRRRTVDVHFDSGSEKGVFKSQMTAMGCGVLTFMMLGMVAYLIVAQLAPLPDTFLHILRILWITPLVLFLMAQVLLPLARERANRQ